MTMQHNNTFYPGTRDEWRKWLQDNWMTADDIWFVFPTKNAGEEGVSYNDAVEEALCFGWIDSTAGRLDEKHQMRRFTPRRRGSSYSRPNIERLIWLDRHNMIEPSVRETVADLIHTPYVFPKDIIDALRANKDAWEFFNTCTESYRRLRVSYVDDARKRPDEFRKRLANLIEKTAARKLVMGYGGVEKYYNMQ